MTRVKQLLQLGPELYLLAATIYYWTLAGLVINPYAIILMSILTFQIISKKTISGLLISSLFVIINLYLVMALISELSEFTEANSNFYKLLIVGSLFLGFNIVAGSFMFYKYARSKKNKNISNLSNN
ncbi:hypothetical protein BTO05_10140 [Winogradskyella sp. PC-19]|uniref:hypothetical protein n=1 Tax=unclassified Winogradskyella TaxID=2615021 RepID=UPI000B3CEA36|nr:MULTISPECIES: hypothetical protein [unclassified Winogradskyella]ARV09978.1 hypothetical protein BTO05_10140 [Winogradskyella sp. PC-19]RZN79949.1 MAG: hypothetical protein EVB12_04445 [Winogradskyella sp.]